MICDNLKLYGSAVPSRSGYGHYRKVLFGIGILDNICKIFKQSAAGLPARKMRRKNG
jgi:hypothetical protein